MRRFLVLLIFLALAGCAPYKKPLMETIDANQTAYLVPLDQNSNQQVAFDSEEFLEANKVATKRVEIPQRGIKVGRSWTAVQWIPTMLLIVVDRQPVTREWTESASTGTSSANQGITAESKESIGFMARMNCAAQIDEPNATKFLYRYPNKQLEQVMDSQIRAKIEAKFVEECSKLEMAEILNRKTEIMEKVRADVIPYFAESGITITVLGLKGEVTYLDPKIQEAINAKFTAEKKRDAQEAVNEMTVSESKAKAEAIEILRRTNTLSDTIRMKEIENQAKAIEKWNGTLPNYLGLGNIPFVGSVGTE